MGALHARTIRELRQATLCGVVDRSEAVVGKVGAELETPAFSEFERAIEETRPDAVIIATPDDAHRAAAETAIRSGLAILLEKPLATSIADAEAIVQLAQRQGTRLLIGHILRFDPRYNQAVDVIRSGQLGRPVVVSAHSWGLKSVGARVASTTSPLWHFGIHQIDAIQWVGGGCIGDIAGAQRITSPGGASAFIATGRLESGGAFQLATGWTLPDGQAVRKAGLEVHCEDGVLSIDWGRDALVTSNATGMQSFDDRGWPELHGRIDGLLRREIEHFVDAILDDTPFVITPEEALNAVRAAVALEQASVAGTLA